MERQEFIKAFHSISKDDYFDSSHEYALVKRCIDANSNDGNTRGHNNLIITMEEFAEMQQAISKNIRGKGDYYNTVEELADVILSVECIKEILGIGSDEIEKAKQVKLKRLEGELLKKGCYK